jgi:hypothetical protein
MSRDNALHYTLSGLRRARQIGLWRGSRAFARDEPRSRCCERDDAITFSGLPSGQFQPRRSEVWPTMMLQVRTRLRRTTTTLERLDSP